MISIRRKLMATQNQPTPTEYITDGLVLWLDGINKGNTPDVWTDLISGYEYDAINGVVFNPDNVQLNGINQYLQNTSFDCPLLRDATIEVVCSAATSTQVLFASKNNSLCFGFYYNNQTSSVIRGIGAYNNRRINPVLEAKGSFSISDANQLRNGRQAEYGNENNFNASNSFNFIGRRSKGSYLNGKIYCIRIYNRQLTLEEAISNYQVDRQRFSLFQN